MSPDTQTQAPAGAHVRVDRDGAVATIHFHRPEGRNSFSVETLDQLLAAVRDVVYDDQVRAVVMVGDERFYCTGADIAEMAENKDRAPAHFDDLTDRYHTLLSLMRSADKTFITALRGVAAGGGVGYALSGDLVVAADDARLLLAYGNLGVSPDGGSTSLLTRALGPHRAREAFLVDEGITAHQMLEWGLVNRVVPAAAVAATAQELAQKVAGRARHTVLATKRLVELATHAPATDVLEAERNLIIEAGGSSDFAEGMTAFLEKRTPRFVSS